MVSNFHKLPAIVATLPGDERNFDQELNAKIREAFPIGSSEENLVLYLKAEGFMPDWRQRSEPNSSSIIHDGLICKKTVHVFWRADAEGILTEVNGSYDSQCLISQP
jgi:hypothetical protein